MRCASRPYKKKRKTLTKKVYNYDPTRTTGLRGSFAAAMKRRFRVLRGLIREALTERDMLGGIAVQFEYTRSGDKVTAFMEWLRRQVDQNILYAQAIPQGGQAIERAWTDIYIRRAYEAGAVRGRQEMRAAGYKVPALAAAEVMTMPVHADRAGVIYARVYEELRGITAQMDRDISRILAQGMIDGDNPRTIARNINRTINGGLDMEVKTRAGITRLIPARQRAVMIARTEVIRAHHLANVQEMINWGVEGVFVKAEFRTAGDDRVCDECADLDGNVYSMQEAQALIPVHPNCRCIVLPIKNNQ